MMLRTVLVPAPSTPSLAPSTTNDSFTGLSGGALARYKTITTGGENNSTTRHLIVGTGQWEAEPCFRGRITALAGNLSADTQSTNNADHYWARRFGQPFKATGGCKGRLYYKKKDWPVLNPGTMECITNMSGLDMSSPWQMMQAICQKYTDVLIYV